MPANEGFEEMSSSIWTRTGHNVVSSGAVTVTPVNVEEIPTNDNTEIIKVTVDGGNVMVKQEINRSDMASGDHSDSDSEVSRIDFTGVTMRSKKFGETGENRIERIERPMSWEGELSDTEDNHLDDDCTTSVTVVNATDLSCCRTSNGDSLDDEPLPLNFTSEVVVDQSSENIMLKGNRNLSSQSEIPLLIGRLLGNCYSPVLQHRSGKSQVCPTASPDSAVHSYYSPTQSPVTSRHLPSSGFSSPATPFTPSLSRNNSDASQYGGSQHSSCYSQSYSSISASPTQFSPNHSPIQRRHSYRNMSEFSTHFGTNNSTTFAINKHASSSSDDNSHIDVAVDHIDDNIYEDRAQSYSSDMGHHSNMSTSSGISRQQLINSPCPICGDKISGFHYGIFSCESCKGFFKRTVQNHKNYVCLRGSSCLVTIATRKKCPACRFDKCLNMGMKLEAIRVDRTRGGRSTYPFSYTLPANITQAQNCNENSGTSVKQESPQESSPLSPHLSNRLIPPLLQEIMEVEHLWQYNEDDKSTIKNNNNPDFLSNLCNIADHRLYKIVKWCKSLPLFKNISIDDQISLLINAWCELLLFSCCYRSMSTPGEIRVSLGKSISLAQAKELGLSPCIERMLNFTEHLRRLRIDRYEYVAMKVIVLLSSDSSDLREPEKARASQEKALQALQQYTIAHYPDMPSKFGELLLRIPDLQRTCQVGKEMLSVKHREGEGPSFNLLMELLRGDH